MSKYWNYWVLTFGFKASFSLYEDFTLSSRRKRRLMKQKPYSILLAGDLKYQAQEMHGFSGEEEISKVFIIGK